MLIRIVIGWCVSMLLLLCWNMWDMSGMHKMQGEDNDLKIALIVILLSPVFVA